jgi:hypothetical protein
MGSAGQVGNTGEVNADRLKSRCLIKLNTPQMLDLSHVRPEIWHFENEWKSIKTAQGRIRMHRVVKK